MLLASPLLASAVRLTALAAVAPLAARASAEPLNPLDYVPPTGGTSMVLLPGTYAVDTDTMTIRPSGGGSIAVGVLSPDNTTVVFAFNALTVPAGATLNIVGKRPCAILAATDLVIAGTINASGGNGQNAVLDSGGGGGVGQSGGAAGGAGSYPVFLGAQTATAGGGLGGGAAGESSSRAGVGGSFGTSPDGGLTYGNLFFRLEGGSGGGGSHGAPIPSGSTHGGGGGAGGGAIELGAIGSLTLTGSTIVANGGNSGSAYLATVEWGGGGSGGGVLLHAANVTLPLSIQAQGGRRGPSGPVTGGSGRIAIQSANNPGVAGLSGVVTSLRTDLSASGIDFGDVPVGGSKIVPMLIQNLGPFPSTINGRFPDPSAGGPFTRMGDAPVFSGVRGGASGGSSYRFAPTAAGTFTQTLTIVSDGGNRQVTLTGRGVLPPAPVCTADLGTAGGLPGQDGLLNNNDFIAFINAFFNQTGCP